MDLHGGCLCRALRYKLTADPLIVHACHCRDCQRVTGSAFVINIWIESRFVESGPAAPKSFMLSGGSGKAHEIFFCESCGTYLWSRYHITRSECLFVRAGTLDNPEAVKPDIHMFTRSKLPWLELPKDVPTFEAAYKLKDVWSVERLERLNRSIGEQT